jgi:hypothetical protein
MGEGYRYAFSLFVPATWSETPDRVVFAQWHSVPDKLLAEGKRATVLKLTIVGDRFKLRGTWDDDLISATWFGEGGTSAGRRRSSGAPG